jgi:hypothetical protein
MFMKKKTQKVTRFIEGLHDFIINNPQFRTKTETRSEREIQAELRPLIIRYLEDHFTDEGYKDAVAKANKAFYWEGQQGRYGKARSETFGTRNYPDFIITDPYLIAVEFKKSPNGSLVKQGIGQSIMHTICEEFDFVYYLFHDESKDKRIDKSIGNDNERKVIDKMWRDFNVSIKFV